MSLPPVAAAVTAEAVAALPARLRARLDAVVEQAQAWPTRDNGASVTVHPDDQTTVTLTPPVADAADATCSCLLAPRCLHRAAVLSTAPVLATAPTAHIDAAENAAAGPTRVEPPRAAEPAPADPPPTAEPFPAATTASTSAAAAAPAPATIAAPDPAGAAPDPAGAAPDPAGATSSGQEPGPVPAAEAPSPAQVSKAQIIAADALWAATAAVLGTGIPGAGAVAQADLLRAVHQARAAGLHAPAAEAIRVVEHLRAARRDDSSFRLADLTADLRDLLGSCHRLAAGDSTAIGVARREYEPVGDLRLHGLFCEPVRAATGHAGAATYLADAQGRLWVVSDVKPAAPEVAGSAARASVDLGEVRLSHHELSRGGILAVNAHASAAGRLSHGRARQAVTIAGCGWFDGPLDALWLADPAAQVDRWLTGTAVPPHERPAAHDLAFLDGVILGADRRGLLLAVGRHDLTVAVTSPHDDPSLPYIANLRLLAAHASGRQVRLVGRFAGSRSVAGLAFAAPWLPARHGGHVDLGATSLTRADLSVADPARPGTEPASAPQEPPLHLLCHQLERVVAAGRAALLSGVDGDARRLAEAHLAGAAAVSAELGAATARRTRDVFGRLAPHDASHLARAWLAAAIYEQAAAREVIRAGWR
jgi:hypothetical protein